MAIRGPSELINSKQKYICTWQTNNQCGEKFPSLSKAKKQIVDYRNSMDYGNV